MGNGQSEQEREERAIFAEVDKRMKEGWFFCVDKGVRSIALSFGLVPFGFLALRPCGHTIAHRSIGYMILCVFRETPTSDVTVVKPGHSVSDDTFRAFFRAVEGTGSYLTICSDSQSIVSPDMIIQRPSNSMEVHVRFNNLSVAIADYGVFLDAVLAMPAENYEVTAKCDACGWTITRNSSEKALRQVVEIVYKSILSGLKIDSNDVLARRVFVSGVRERVEDLVRPTALKYGVRVNVKIRSVYLRVTCPDEPDDRKEGDGCATKAVIQKKKNE